MTYRPRQVRLAVRPDRVRRVEELDRDRCPVGQPAGPPHDRLTNGRWRRPSCPGALGARRRALAAHELDQAVAGQLVIHGPDGRTPGRPRLDVVHKPQVRRTSCGCGSSPGSRLSERRRSVRDVRQDDQPITFHEPGRIDYAEAWRWQRELAEARAAGTGPDSVLLLEHPSVYTAGKRTRPEDRPIDGTPVVEVDRGGRITWHGPGQLVGYPIVGLAAPFDVVAYVRLLEQVLIESCAGVGVTAGRVAGRSGVWLAADERRPERKVAAIGVRVARGVTQHGFALNCSCDLAAFDAIVPCGITDAGVTSLSAEAGRKVTVSEMKPIVRELLDSALNGRLPITEADIPRVAASSPDPATDGIRWRLDPALQGTSRAG